MNPTTPGACVSTLHPLQGPVIVVVAIDRGEHVATERDDRDRLGLRIGDEQHAPIVAQRQRLRAAARQRAALEADAESQHLAIGSRVDGDTVSVALATKRRDPSAVTALAFRCAPTSIRVMSASARRPPPMALSFGN